MTTNYFGLDEAAVVVGLARPPPPPPRREEGAAGKVAESRFYYDYSLERLILAEGKLEDAAARATGGSEAVEGVGREEASGKADSQAKVDAATDDPCFSLSPVVQRARKSSAAFARRASRGFLRLSGRPSLSAPAGQSKSPASMMMTSHHRKRERPGNAWSNTPGRVADNARSPAEGHKRSKRSAAVDDIGPAKELKLDTTTRLSVLPFCPSPQPGPTPAPSPAVTSAAAPSSLLQAKVLPRKLPLLLSARHDITDGVVVQKLMQRLGELEEMVENLQRKSNGVQSVHSDEVATSAADVVQATGPS
jgi:hypothetical protein